MISKYEKNQTVTSVMMTFDIDKALNVSLDFLISSDKALFIDDKELIDLLKNYNKLNEYVKNILKALNLYFRKLKKH